MRKIGWFLLLSAIIVSCDKIVKQPVNYAVTTDAAQTGVYNIYIPDSGTYTLSAYVQFLSGYPSDSIKLILSGVPAGVKVSPDTISGIPTYTANFSFTTNHMTQGVYPVTLTAYTPTRTPQAYNFSMYVIPADAASLFWGALSDSNACTNRNYKFSATGQQTGITNQLVINNFGGYGSEVNVTVYFNEQNGTLSIPRQICGNGSTVYGSGTFTNTKMIINYTATSTPTNPAESCTSVYSK